MKQSIVKTGDKSRRYRVPKKEVKELLDKKARDLLKLGYSYEEIAGMLHISKAAVFFAIKGRAKKRVSVKS